MDAFQDHQEENQKLKEKQIYQLRLPLNWNLHDVFIAATAGAEAEAGARAGAKDDRWIHLRFHQHYALTKEPLESFRSLCYKTFRLVVSSLLYD